MTISEEALQRIRQRKREKEGFRELLEEQYGLAGHRKAQRLFELAWDHGHAYGFPEVRDYYEEFMELLDR